MGVDTLKLVSLNVRGISNFRKRRMIYTCIFLQETHSKKDTETQWKNEWGGRDYYVTQKFKFMWSRNLAQERC